MYAPISLCIFCERPHVPVSPVGVYVCIVHNYTPISLCISCERPHVPVSPVGVYVCIVLCSDRTNWDRYFGYCYLDGDFVYCARNRS